MHTLITADGKELKPTARNIVRWLNEPHRRRLGDADAANLRAVFRGAGNKAQARRAVERLSNSKRLAKEHRVVLMRAIRES